MKNPILLTGMTVLLSACGRSEPPIKIETYDRTNAIFNVPYVEVDVTAVVDKITIENIIVNRGNCKIENVTYNGRRKLPRKLVFGESVSVSFGTPCYASEVEVETNQGSWTMAYD